MKREAAENPGARARHTSPSNQDGNVARALQTPTDLSPSNVNEVAAALNPIVADSFALYVKTKNFHWHLSGPHFRDFHLLFDEQAEAIFEGIDIIAERVRKIGGVTLRSISDISRLQTIEDDNDDFVQPFDMIKRLLRDNRAVAAGMRNAISVCEDNGDHPSSNILQDMLDQTERRVWFLSEILRVNGSHPVEM